ncbi:MAG: helix-turn-helix domain-containing protein [Armatimonadota bacterium]|nr:helix-turn-helix domain-containing protein [bacterium]
MANYDNRLGEWFKQVERSAEELKKKKNDDGQEPQQQSFPEIEEHTGEPRADITRQPADELESRERLESAVATMESSQILIEESAVSEPKAQPELTQPLFEDTEIPPVEDFFSFLDHKSEPHAQVKDASLTVETPPSMPLLRASEGTGEPRPIVSNSVPQQTVCQPSRIFTPPIVEKAAAPTVVAADEQPDITHPVEANDSQLQENWDRMPHHLQTLFGIAGEEVAQNSYKAFKESRGELIQRLLDPPLTLEEAARILNVCPTTVRRYTNRGVLAHFRTAGNQRRFRLSDVLSFMESNNRENPAESEG